MGGHICCNTEVLGENGLLGRKSNKKIVLTRYLQKCSFDNNDLTEEYADFAVKTLCAYIAVCSCL